MKVLVVSAHPDDEVLGCGGTLAKHRDNGDEISWLISTSMFENQGFSPKKIQTRQNEIKTISNQLKMVNVFELNYPTMSLSYETLVQMIPQVAEIIKSIEPEVIYILNRSDAHTDHLITFKSVLANTKSFRHPYIKLVLMYECISETEFAPALSENTFIPNYYIDISEHINEKISLMKVYKSELGEHPFPRNETNIKALATFRGASVGVNYAEAFQLLKFIDKA